MRLDLNDGAFWSIFWTIMGATIMVCAFFIRGCAPEITMRDNDLKAHAIEEGCTILPASSGYHYLCNGEIRK